MKMPAITALLLFIALSVTEPLMAQSAIQRNTAAIETQGGLEPMRITEVSTAEVGIVKEIVVKPGDEVSQGMPLGYLESEQQRAVLKEAELDAFATGTIETAKSEVNFNRRRVFETRPLVEMGRASPRELERFQMELSIAEAKLQTQEEAKMIAKARLEKAQIAFNDRTLRAPHDGIVVEIYKEAGEYIAGNAPAVVRIVDISKLRASFMLPEPMAERFRHRSEADIRLPNHAVVRGQIEYIAPFADAEGRTIAMTVLIDNADQTIRSAHCELVP